MKKYKLLKDLPHAKAGTIFEGTDEGLVNTFQYATGTKDTYHLHTYIHKEWIKEEEENIKDEQENVGNIFPSKEAAERELLLRKLQMKRWRPEEAAAYGTQMQKVVDFSTQSISMKRWKWHVRQLYLTWKTRKYRGEMDLIFYHAFRLNKLWEYRCADIHRPLDERYV